MLQLYKNTGATGAPAAADLAALFSADVGCTAAFGAMRGPCALFFRVCSCCRC
jgi:hypothetical protein